MCTLHTQHDAHLIQTNRIIDEMWLHIQTRDLVVFMIFFLGLGVSLSWTNNILIIIY